MKKWGKEMRVSHYIKNVLILAPVFFGSAERGGGLTGTDMWRNLLSGFFAFCLLSSTIYLINDIKDIEKDRMHERKRHRPIAAGEITVPQAIAAAILFLAVAFATVVCFLDRERLWSALIIMGVYFGINMCYSVWRLKDIPLLDVVLLAAGFWLRLQMGAAVSGIAISDWLSLVTISGAFYLGFGKRRNELRHGRLADGGHETRAALAGYTWEFLEKSMTICLTMALIFFSLWSIEKRGESLFILSVPFLMLICFRYNMDIEKEECDGDPVPTILEDKVLITLIVGFLLFMSAFLYQT
ncbi:MAG: UbiA prenyltransferase family protein [Clostridiales bacterium]|nr:UbiA prenyltransferase family protein [Clostridiales bacterium]